MHPWHVKKVKRPIVVAKVTTELHFEQVYAGVVTCSHLFFAAQRVKKLFIKIAKSMEKIR